MIESSEAWVLYCLFIFASKLDELVVTISYNKEGRLV